MKHFSKVIIGVAVSLFLFYQTGYGQQSPGFIEYNYNPYLINPAFAGLTPDAEISLANSGFFNQLEGSPKSFSLGAHTALRRPNVGLGIGFLQDEIGVTSSTNAFTTYSYKLFFDTKSNRPYWQIYTPNVLSFAISAGLQQYQDNLLELGIQGDSSFSENINASVPTIGLGMVLNLANFYIGVSSPNILGDRLATDQNLNFSTVYYGYIGYRFFSNRFEDIMIKPNALLKMEQGAPIQIDLNLAMGFRNRFEVGGGYRSNASYTAMGGVYFLKNMRLVYQYTIATNDSPLGNTHGLVATYRFGHGFYE